MGFAPNSLDGLAASRYGASSWKRFSLYPTMKSIGGILLCFLFATFVAHAQGVGSSGEITGTVTDASGGVLPKATINVVDTQTGLKRTAITNDTGQFRVVGLSPATYDISAQMAGFATEIRRGVPVAIGQTVTFDFKMKPSKVATVVEVTDQPPVVETERGSQADRISQQYIADLPIDRRDYLTFTLLAPGVSDSTRLAGDQDFRVKQTPQSGLSFYGSNGRGNDITVDGGETSDDAGGVRLTVSQDDVQEFQINRSNYAADLGAATGASINIVTKSGTNNVHGSLFGFFRNDAMDARDPFAYSQALLPGQTFDPANPDTFGSPIKDTLSRQQFGANVGFPIKKDRTFLFLAFEGLRQDAQNAVPILTDTDIFRPSLSQNTVIGGLTGGTVVPCLSGPVGAAVAQQLGLPAPNPTTNLPAAECGAILSGVLTVDPATSPLNAFLVNQFETQGGVFPYDSHQYLASGRLDHRFDVNNEISVSYRYGHDLEESPDVQSLTAFSAGSSIHNYDNNLQLAWYREFSPATQNEARVQWDYNSFNVIPNEPAEVGLQIPGFINNLGTNIFLPNITILRRYEFADNFTLNRGRHTFKFGGSEILRGNHTESHTFFPGRFVFGSLPGVVLSPLVANLTSLTSGIVRVAGDLPAGLRKSDIPVLHSAVDSVLHAGFLEDSAKLHSGLRAALRTGFAIRASDHLHEGFRPSCCLRVGSVQGSQDGDPGRVWNLLRTRGRPNPRRRLEPGGCEQEQIRGREHAGGRPGRELGHDLRVHSPGQWHKPLQSRNFHLRRWLRRIFEWQHREYSGVGNDLPGAFCAGIDPVHNANPGEQCLHYTGRRSWSVWCTIWPHCCEYWSSHSRAGTLREPAGLPPPPSATGVIWN